MDVREGGVQAGHEQCHDVHQALFLVDATFLLGDEGQHTSSVAAAIRRRVEALEVEAALPYLFAMVGVIGQALALAVDAGGLTEDRAWAQVRSSVLDQHCPDPASWRE